MNKAGTVAALLLGVAAVAVVLSLTGGETAEPGDAASPSTEPRIPTCTAADLRAEARVTESISGTQFTWIVATNVSSRPCELPAEITASTTELNVFGDGSESVTHVATEEMDPDRLDGSALPSASPRIASGESVMFELRSAAAGFVSGPPIQITLDARLDIGGEGTVAVPLAAHGIGHVLAWFGPVDVAPDIEDFVDAKLRIPLPPEGLPPCTAATLRADILSGDGVAGTRYTQFLLTNTSDTHCGLPADLALTAAGTAIAEVDRGSPIADYYADAILAPGERVAMIVRGLGSSGTGEYPDSRIHEFTLSFPGSEATLVMDVRNAETPHYTARDWYGPLPAGSSDDQYPYVGPLTSESGTHIGAATEFGSDHLGPVRVNSTPRQLADAFGEALLVWDQDDDCLRASVGPSRSLVAFKWNSAVDAFLLHAFTVEIESVQTARGIHVGSTFAELLEAYPDAREIESARVPLDSAWEWGENPGAARQLVFGVRDGVVARMTGGYGSSDRADCS